MTRWGNEENSVRQTIHFFNKYTEFDLDIWIDGNV